MPKRIIAGGVPEPEELYGRKNAINYIWEQLDGNNVSLVAPRRFGKTGVMNHLLRRPRSGYLPVYLEVEELHDPERFAAALVASLLEQSKLRTVISGIKNLPETVLNFISSRIQNIKTFELEIELRDLVKNSWDTVTRTLILEMEKADETILFIIDEFPQFIENVARKHGDETARGFLQWFRSLRMRQKDLLRRYRFLVGGSPPA
jgi:AAA+ ATPase superfamily predicted ATPase